MPICDLIEYIENYSKTGSLWQYYRDEPFLRADGAIAEFPADNNDSALFKCKTKIPARTRNDGPKNLKIMLPLKYLSNFWSVNCFIIDAPANQQVPKSTNRYKLYVPVVTLSTQE